MGKEPRPYQIEGIKKIFDSWRNGKRSVLFQMPTGTGKTVLFSHIVRMGYEKGRKILIVVHRIELVDQITKSLQNEGINVGQIVSGKNSDYSKIVQVASIQTLSRRQHPEANLIIIDECHHSKASTYTTLWDIYPNAKFLGVTATPIRLSGEGFEDIFDKLITSPSIQYFIDQGYLVPVSHFVCSLPDLSGVKQRKGDYITSMLSEVMIDNSLMSDLVESYKDKCNGKSTIVFAVDIEHSQQIAERYNMEGILAAHIDSGTPNKQREQILQDFKNKKIKVVSNVEIITEGFDFPECEVVQLARPTKSLSLYLQMVGRVMRTADGKTEGIILDNAGLWLEHGLSTIDREWKLEGRKRKANKSEPTEIASDNEGNIVEINRHKPIEVKGLKLIPLTAELNRLIQFEFYVKQTIAHSYNLMRAYYSYLESLEKKNVRISKYEFEYIKRRLNSLNSILPKDKQFKSGAWFYEAKKFNF